MASWRLSGTASASTPTSGNGRGTAASQDERGAKTSRTEGGKGGKRAGGRKRTAEDGGSRDRDSLQNQINVLQKASLNLHQRVRAVEATAWDTYSCPAVFAPVVKAQAAGVLYQNKTHGKSDGSIGPVHVHKVMAFMEAMVEETKDLDQIVMKSLMDYLTGGDMATVDDVFPFFKTKILRTKHDDDDDEDQAMDDKIALIQIGYNSLTLMEAAAGSKDTAIHSVRKVIHHTVLRVKGTIKIGTAPPGHLERIIQKQLRG